MHDARRSVGAVVDQVKAMSQRSNDEAAVDVVRDKTFKVDPLVR